MSLSAGAAPGDLRVASLEGLHRVAPAAWDALAPGDDPFLAHAFLAGLEQTGCVGEGTGWIPRHVVARETGGKLVGAVPLYEKDDSFGEYIFDWGWAHAAQRAGVPYYPKLVAAVPFTPVTGPRLLVRPDADRARVIPALLDGIDRVARAVGAHSVHVLFCTAEEKARLAGAGWLPRLSEQFHWRRDPAWADFEDYLGAMRSAARKQVRRERRLAREHGLSLRMWSGEELGDAEWGALYRFYRRTARRKGGMAYLNRAFFEHLRGALPHRVRVAFAHRDARPVAGALFLTRGDALFGRYWGAERDLDALHFELSYYLPIEWGLAHGIRRFEAGAQGEHKLKRGLMPAACHSAHRLEHPGLARAVAAYVDGEAAAVREGLALLERHGPFRRGDPSDQR